MVEQGVVNAGPVLAAISLQPYSECPVLTAHDHAILLGDEQHGCKSVLVALDLAQQHHSSHSVAWSGSQPPCLPPRQPGTRQLIQKMALESLTLIYSTVSIGALVKAWGYNRQIRCLYSEN